MGRAVPEGERTAQPSEEHRTFETALEPESAAFTEADLASMEARVEAAIAELAAGRSELYEDFAGRGTRVVVRVAAADRHVGLRLTARTSSR